jgi:chromosome segregation ATPase
MQSDAVLGACKNLEASASQESDSRGCSDEEYATLRQILAVWEQRAGQLLAEIEALKAQLSVLRRRYDEECIRITVSNSEYCMALYSEIDVLERRLQRARANHRHTLRGLQEAKNAVEDCERRRGQSDNRAVVMKGGATVRVSAGEMSGNLRAAWQYCGVAASDPNEKTGSPVPGRTAISLGRTCSSTLFTSRT